MNALRRLPARWWVTGLIALAIATVIVIAGISKNIGKHQPTRSPAKKANTASVQAQNAQPVPASSDQQKTGAPAAHADTPTQSSTEPSAAATPAIPNTAACRLLTLDIARQLLGAKVAYDTASDSAAAKTTDRETTVCAYGSGQDSSRQTVTLVMRVALTELGGSENAIVFGSARPAGVIDMPGYGQAAYWDPAGNVLNILDNNNWLTLSRTKGSPAIAGDQGEVEAAAKSIKVGL